MVCIHIQYVYVNDFICLRESRAHQSVNLGTGPSTDSQSTIYVQTYTHTEINTRTQIQNEQPLGRDLVTNVAGMVCNFFGHQISFSLAQHPFSLFNLSNTSMKYIYYEKIYIHIYISTIALD